MTHARTILLAILGGLGTPADGPTNISFDAVATGKPMPSYSDRGVVFALSRPPAKSRAAGKVMFFPHLKTPRKGILNAMADESIPVEIRFPKPVAAVTLVLWGSIGSEAVVEAYDADGNIADRASRDRVPERTGPEQAIPSFEMTVKAPAIVRVHFSGAPPGGYLVCDEVRARHVVEHRDRVAATGHRTADCSSARRVNSTTRRERRWSQSSSTASPPRTSSNPWPSKRDRASSDSPGRTGSSTSPFAVSSTGPPTLLEHFSSRARGDKFRAFQPFRYRSHPSKMKPAYLLLAALSVVTVTTNTAAREPDPNFHIYLCFGQSNMEGFPGVEQQDKAEDERFQVLAAVDFPKLGRKKGSWYPAVPPCAGNLPASAPRIISAGPSWLTSRKGSGWAW